MSFVWATCRKDLLRRLRDPVGLVLWIGIPILVGAILTLLSGGREGPKPQAFVLVADQDDSFVSGLLVGALSQDRVGGVMRAEAVTREEGQRRMEEGDATALLVIPEGFGDAVLRETPATLTVRTNPAQRILPGIVEESLRALSEGVFYAHRVFGDELRRIAQPPAGATPAARDLAVADLSVRINQAIERVRGTLFPPVIAFETGPDPADAARAAADSAAAAAEGAAEGRTPMALLFVPGLLFMSFLFMSSGLAEDLWAEREQHTLRRAASTPRAAAAVLGGKLLAGAALFLVVSAIALSVAWAWFGIPWARYPGAVAWGVFSALILLLIFCVIQVHASTRRGASVLSTAIVFPLMMLGGSFFPFEAMPDWMVAIGRWTPNGWALARLKEIVLGRVDPSGLLRSAAFLGAVGLVLFAIASRRLGAAFSRG